MYELESLEHLVCQHENGLEAELPLAVVEQVLQGWTQQVDDHDIIVSLHPEPVHVRNAHYRKKVKFRPMFPDFQSPKIN